MFGPLAHLLSPRWTVVTYVRRGFVPRPVDGEVGEDELGADVSDAAALIERHGGPAVVLGSSSGAIVALELLVRRPDLVRVLVAHEPPLVSFLPDRDALVARFDAVFATYRREGVVPAMVEFGEVTGVGVRRPPAAVDAVPPEFVAMRERRPVNCPFWFDHEYGPYPVHELDLTALRRHADRLVLAVGHQSREGGQLAGRPNVVLGRELGLDVLEVPGGHLGYVEDPVGFAAALDGAVRLLAGES